MHDDDEDLRALQFEHFGGRASALESASEEARCRAGQYYAQSRDQEAKWMRDISVWLFGLACDARKQQKAYEKMHHGGIG